MTAPPTAAQLKAARAWLGWTLEKAAQASGINRQTISRIETGQSTGTSGTIQALVRTYANAGMRIDKGVLQNDNETSS